MMAFIRRHKWALSIAAVVSALIMLTVAWYMRPSMPDLPMAVEVAILAGVGAFALGYVPAWGLLNLLHNPPKRYVVCLGLSDEPAEQHDLPPEAAEPGIYELSPAAFERVTCLADELYHWNSMEYPTYEALAFDKEELEAVGTWRGSKSDRELLRREREIDELRANLEQAADYSVDLEISISSKVRQAVKEIGRAIIEEHAEASTYNGERVAEVLSEVREDIEQDTAEEERHNGQKELKTLEAIDGGHHER